MKAYHLQVSDTLASRIDHICELTDAASQAAVLRDAICIYSWLLGQLESGKTVIAVGDDESHSELSTPGMEVVKAKILTGS